jgi:hypothetical protein
MSTGEPLNGLKVHAPEHDAEIARLKKSVKSLRRRLRAVKQYYGIADSDIAKVVRLGYGS